MALSPSATDAAIALVEQLKVAAGQMTAARKARALMALDALEGDLRKDAEEAAIKSRLAPPSPQPVYVVGGSAPAPRLTRRGY